MTGDSRTLEATMVPWILFEILVIWNICLFSFVISLLSHLWLNGWQTLLTSYLFSPYYTLILPTTIAITQPYCHINLYNITHVIPISIIVCCNIIFDNEITLPARLRLCFVNLLFESELDMITLRIKLGSSSRFGFWSFEISLHKNNM